MKADKMGEKNFAFTLGLVIAGTAGVTGVGRELGSNAWQSLLAGMLLSFGLYFLYHRLVSAYPGLGLFAIIRRQFGAVFGGLLTVLIMLYAAARCALALRHFGEFVYVTSLHKTPQLVFLLCLGFLCALGACVRPEALGRMGAFLFLLAAAAAVLAFLANMPNMDLAKLFPVLPALSYGVIADVIAFPFGDAFLLLCLFDGIPSGQGGYPKFAWGLCLGSALLLIAQLHNLLTLGPALTAEEYFPFYPAMSLIDLGDFFQRIEALASGTLLFGCFIKGAVCVMVISRGFACLCGAQEEKPAVYVPFLAALVCAGWASVMFSSTMQMFEQAALYKLGGLPLQVGLILLMWLISEFYRRSPKARADNPNASATG